MLGRSRRQALLLERHWRSLARHRAADAPSGLDPDLAETVADLARCAERLRPDARAIDATRHQLAAHTREASERRAWTGPALAPRRRPARMSDRVEADGQSERLLLPVEEPGFERPRSWPRELLKLAAAALVFGVIGVLLALVLRDDQSSRVEGPEVGTPTPVIVRPTAVPTWEISATIPVGAGGFHSIASGEESVWVTNTIEGTVSRIDPRTNTVSATIQAGEPAQSSGQPNVNGIAVGEEAVWVARTVEGDVVRIDPASNEVVAAIDIDGSPVGAAEGHGSIWVAVSEGAVVRIDPATNAVVATIGIYELAVSVSADASGVWVTAQAAPWANTLIRIDPATNRIADTISLDVFGGGIVADASGVWLHSTSTVLRFEPGFDTATVVVPLQGSLTGGIVTGDQAIWATLNQGVVLIDSATRAIVATVVIPGTAGIVSHPNSIIVTGQTAWVVTKDDIVVRIDPTS